MTDDMGVQDDFVRSFGAPDEEATPLQFSERFVEEDWQERHARTGAGWFLGRFFFLLGEGLERLTPCLEAWSFLLPPAEERRILGYNAYGTLLVMDDEEQDGLVAAVRMIDPLNVIAWSDPECVYTTLLNHWLADRALPNFFDTSVYLEWLEGAGRFLADDEILGINAPVPLGGEMTLANFTPMNIVDYYLATGPVYAKAHGQPFEQDEQARQGQEGNDGQ